MIRARKAGCPPEKRVAIRVNMAKTLSVDKGHLLHKHDKFKHGCVFVCKHTEQPTSAFQKILHNCQVGQATWQKAPTKKDTGEPHMHRLIHE